MNDQSQGAYSDYDDGQNQGAYVDSTYEAPPISYIPLKIAPPSGGWAPRTQDRSIFTAPESLSALVSMATQMDNTSLPLHQRDLQMQLQGLFIMCDSNSDGFLNRSELLQCLQMIGLAPSEALIQRYIPVSYAIGARDQSIGGGVGQARVPSSRFVDVTLDELASNDCSALMNMQADLEHLLKRDGNSGYDECISLRSMRHYLTEITFHDGHHKSNSKSSNKRPPPGGAMQRKEYNHFLRSLGILQDSSAVGTNANGKKQSNGLLLASRELEFGIDIDALIGELVI